MIASVSAGMTMQSTWTPPTYEEPLRSDLRYALEGRLQSRCRTYQQWQLAAWASIGVVALALLAWGSTALLWTHDTNQTVGPLRWDGTMVIVIPITLLPVVLLLYLRTKRWEFQNVEHDVRGGVQLETVGTITVQLSGHSRYADQILVNDRVIGHEYRLDRRAIATLYSLGTLHDATIRYSPNAGVLLEVVTANGVLVYRPPELMAPPQP